MDKPKNRIKEVLEEKGIKVYKALVGPFACSMDMAGMSVTLMKLDDELKELKSVIRKNKTSKTIRCRCQIIIDLDESHGKVLTHEQSAKSNGVCLATVTNTVKKYFEGGIDAVTEFKRNVNSDNARRVLDGRAEARIIELACGPVPEVHSRWTILLLEEKAKIVLDTPVSREAIRRTLKKQTSTSQKRLLVHHLKRRCRICSLYGRCP